MNEKPSIEPNTPNTISYGKYCFSDSVMKQYYEQATFDKIKKVRSGEIMLDASLADKVAAGMRKWALDNGCEHWAHWFQPLNGQTAEKHNAFAEPIGKGLTEAQFSGSDLMKGESDASSFPSGGLRSTFEARGDTMWDAKSPAFIRTYPNCKVLMIPSTFSSSKGESLDLKTPLLRSIKAIEDHAGELFEALGCPTGRIKVQAGPEQEYFLVDKAAFDSRLDLKLIGKALFGSCLSASATSHHYFGDIQTKVKRFMIDVDRKLWELGVAAKTEHKEAAASQFELAVVFGDANIATDQNQIVMEVLCSTAQEHGLAVLLHEKPFKGVNGSGKHINWSVSDSTGRNIFKVKNEQDIVPFVFAVALFVAAVDEYNPLIAASVASISNDERLGGHEAPPAFYSVYLGENLSKLFDLTADELSRLTVSDLKNFSSDRNRTSPIAFTGSKFEFRSPGSSKPISFPITALNAAFAGACKEAIPQIRAAQKTGQNPLSVALKIYGEHKRVVYNDNCYDEKWETEAQKRGLKKFASTPLALAALKDTDLVSALSELGIFSPQELQSRRAILLEDYEKSAYNEASLACSIFTKTILPGALKDLGQMRSTLQAEEIPEAKPVVAEFVRAINESCKSYNKVSKMLSQKAQTDTLLSELEQFCRAVSHLIEFSKSAEGEAFPTDKLLMTL